MLTEEQTEELRGWLSLHHVSGVSLADKHELLRRFGSPRRLVAPALARLIERSSYQQLHHALQQGVLKSKVNDDLCWANEPGHHILPFTHAAFPPLLKQISDPPLLLYALGDPARLNAPQIAIVGSRNPTPYGRRVASLLAASLSRCGIGIVSGLALGIDAAAHAGALDNHGFTIVVAAHGLNHVYPRRHRELAARILENGVLVSEYPPGVPPRRFHFPQRNRIISGLSLGTLVVEATVRSGSLITARSALEQNREVFAIPGPIHSPLSRGTNDLIRQGAKLVECVEDVLVELPLSKSPSILSPPRSSKSIPEEYRQLLTHMGYDPVNVDTLVARSGLTAESVSSMLLKMEIVGLVDAFAGQSYIRTVDR